MQNVWLGAFGFSWKAGKAKKQFQTARMDSKDGDLKLSWLEQKKFRFCCSSCSNMIFFQGMDVFCLSYLQFKTVCSIKCCQNPIKMKYVLVSLNWDFISCVYVCVSSQVKSSQNYLYWGLKNKQYNFFSSCPQKEN